MSANLRCSECFEEGSGGGLISPLAAVAIPAMKVTLEQSCGYSAIVNRLVEVMTSYK